MYNAQKWVAWSGTLVVQESLIALDIQVSLRLQLNQSNLHSQQAEIQAAADALCCCTVCTGVNAHTATGLTDAENIPNIHPTYYLFPESHLAHSFPRNILSACTQQIDTGHVSFIDRALNSGQCDSSTGISESCDLPALSAGISTITLLRQVVIDATLDPYPEQNEGGGRKAAGYKEIC